VDRVEVQLRDGARLDETKVMAGLIGRRSIYTAWTPGIEGIYVPRVHAVSTDNERAALQRRVLGPTPAPTEPGQRSLRASFRRLARVARRYGGETWTHLQVAESYEGVLRKRYLEAERSLREDGPIGSGDWFLRSFLKTEKWTADKLAKPRLIFPRSPRYNLDLASRLKPFEHWLWGNLKSVASRGVAPTRVVAKGLNPVQRANLIDRKMRSFAECVVFEVDGKAFEAHLDESVQLRGEQSVYAAAFPNDKHLMWLLGKQLSMVGKTQTGIRFRRSGGRASGDFNTGMGNSICMLAVVDAVMRSFEGVAFDSLVDGDNALIFVGRRDSREVVGEFGERALAMSGHEMVLERPVSHIEGVRFGRSAPVEANGRLTMVRDWTRVLSGGTSSHIHLREPSFRGEFLQGVALCEGAMAVGVPVIGAWAEALRRSTERQGSVRSHPHRDYRVYGLPVDALLENPKSRYLDPTEESRQSFDRAFGVDPDRQRAIEEVLMRGFMLTEPTAYEALDVCPGDVLCSRLPPLVQ